MKRRRSHSHKNERLKPQGLYFCFFFSARAPGRWKNPVRRGAPLHALFLPSPHSPARWAPHVTYPSLLCDSPLLVPSPDSSRLSPLRLSSLLLPAPPSSRSIDNEHLVLFLVLAFGVATLGSVIILFSLAGDGLYAGNSSTLLPGAIDLKWCSRSEAEYGCSCFFFSVVRACLQENAMATDESTADHRGSRPSSHDMDLSGDDHVPKVPQFPA